MPWCGAVVATAMSQPMRAGYRRADLLANLVSIAYICWQNRIATSGVTLAAALAWVSGSGHESRNVACSLRGRPTLRQDAQAGHGEGQPGAPRPSGAAIPATITRTPRPLTEVWPR